MCYIARFFVIMTFLLTSSLYASIGKVSLLKGEAFAQRNTKSITLQNASPIEEKDIITTSKGSQIQLIFEDKTVITLGGESQFKIEEYLNDAVKPKAKFKFGQGTFKSITGSIGKVAPENFTLETKTATIGIRGTIVGGTIPPPSSPGPDAIFCLSGAITATPLGGGVVGGQNTVLIPAGSMSLVPVGGLAPPSPPRPFSPQELGQFNQALGATPSPGAGAGTGDNQPQSGNTPPTSNTPSEGGDTPSPSPTPQGFTPTAASGASQTNTQNSTQNQVTQEVAAGLGVSLSDLQNQTCPAGQSGTFPNCGTCTALQSGTYPNCVDLTCPTGTTGTYPNCGTCTALQSGTYPNCVDLTCPTGTTGTYPNCGTCTALQSGTYPNCVDLTCPTGTTGTYPNCGTCTALQSGTYPNCVDLTCPAGTTGTYPNCGTCTALQSGTYPNCVNLTCPSGTSGTYPNCVNLTCSAGTSGTYPNCVPIASLDLVGLSTSSAIQSNTIQHTHDNDFVAIISNAITTGEISLGNLALPFSSTSVSITSPTLFTVTIPDANITQLSSITSPVSNVLWGKWTSLEMDSNATLMPTNDNYWVAGKTADKTAAASHIATIYNNIDTYTNYTYLGKSMGTVYNSSGQSFAIDPVNDATNEVKLVFQFGNAEAPIAYPDSHIRFTANGYWDITTYPGAADASENGTFWAMLSGTGAISGSMNGAFYGANAESLGGTFKASNPDTSSSAVGAFVASKVGSETRTFLLGLATSSYIFNSDLTYSTTDDVEFDLVNSNAVEGTINLGRDIPESTSGEAISLSSFGSSSSDLYWGKWTSAEMDNNNTLIASADNYWVAGLNRESAGAYISSLRSYPSAAPILTYTGNVIGSTYASGTRYAIDENLATNKVQLQFNLGESCPIDTTNSFITFVSNGGTWLLKPDSADASFPPNGGTFHSFFTAASSSGDGSSIIDGSIDGVFYGDEAKALGGTFQATSDSGLTALGVFKTIKTSEFYYPSSFSPALDTITTDVGSVNFTGFATSDYTVSNALYLSSSDTLDLTINTTNTPSISGSITYAGRSGNFTLSQSALGLGDDSMTYTDRNNFAIKDFDANKGYMVTDNTEPNDYVSWGYWAVNSQDSSKLTNTQNYWVGGSQADADAAILYIAGLATPEYYIYTGKVLGNVEEAGIRYDIADNAANSVQLKFDFGGGTNSIYHDSSYSWIKFSANDKLWNLKPTLTTPTVTNGTFSDGLTGTVTGELAIPVTAGAIKGKFYGDQAQAVGGTFNAATATATAVGVFKAVR